MIQAINYDTHALLEDLDIGLSPVLAHDDSSEMVPQTDSDSRSIDDIVTMHNLIPRDLYGEQMLNPIDPGPMLGPI